MIFQPKKTLSARNFLKFLKLFYDADYVYWERDDLFGISQRYNKTQTVFYRDFEVEIKTQRVFLKLNFINLDEEIVLVLEFDIKLFAESQAKFTRYKRSSEPYEYFHSCLDFLVVCKNTETVRLE